jgi:hypothetical protein
VHSASFRLHEFVAAIQSHCLDPIDRRAGCGRSASPVREEGPASSIPVPTSSHSLHTHKCKSTICR